MPKALKRTTDVTETADPMSANLCQHRAYQCSGLGRCLCSALRPSMLATAQSIWRFITGLLCRLSTVTKIICYHVVYWKSVSARYADTIAHTCKRPKHAVISSLGSALPVVYAMLVELQVLSWEPNNVTVVCIKTRLIAFTAFPAECRCVIDDRLQWLYSVLRLWRTQCSPSGPHPYRCLYIAK